MNATDLLTAIEPMMVSQASGQASGYPGTTPASGADMASSTDITLFAQSIEHASAVRDLPDTQATTRAVLEPLGALDREAAELGEFARTALDSGDELTPGEIVSLTVKSQEFMFHSQLTANVANRTADGLQQLFRQQG